MKLGVKQEKCGVRDRTDNNSLHLGWVHLCDTRWRS